MRSLTTEKPTDPTAPRPMPPTIWAPRNAAKFGENGVAKVPAAQISVPSMSSILRLDRSPT
jgi:hypothetical protein